MPVHRLNHAITAQARGFFLNLLEILREAQQVDEEILPLLLTPREIAPSVPMHLAVLQPHRRPISPLTLARSELALG